MLLVGCLSTRFPLTVDSLITARKTSVHPGRTERMSLLYKLRDVMLAWLTSSSQVLTSSSSRTERDEILWVSNPDLIGMVRYFSIEILLWRLRSGIVMVDNHTIANNTGTFSPEGLSQGFWYGAVPVSVNCVRVPGRPPETSACGKRFASRLCHFTIRLPGWGKRVSNPWLIAYWREWNEGAMLCHQKPLDAVFVYRLLCNLTLVRHYSCWFFCSLLTHEARTWLHNALK